MQSSLLCSDVWSPMKLVSRFLLFMLLLILLFFFFHSLCIYRKIGCINRNITRKYINFNVVWVEAKNLIKIPFHTGATSTTTWYIYEKIYIRESRERERRSEHTVFVHWCITIGALYAGITIFRILLFYVKRDIFHERLQMQHFQLPPLYTSCPSTFSAWESHKIISKQNKKDASVWT